MLTIFSFALDMKNMTYPGKKKLLTKCLCLTDTTFMGNYAVCSGQLMHLAELEPHQFPLLQRLIIGFGSQFC